MRILALAFGSNQDLFRPAAITFRRNSEWITAAKQRKTVNLRGV
jgi:hypothetical protein